MEDGSGAWDLSTIAEEDFDQIAVYIVPDQPKEEIEAIVKTKHITRAEASLPRNLVLKSSQSIKDVS